MAKLPSKRVKILTVLTDITNLNKLTETADGIHKVQHTPIVNISTRTDVSCKTEHFKRIVANMAITIINQLVQERRSPVQHTDGNGTIDEGRSVVTAEKVETATIAGTTGALDKGQ